MSKQTMIKADLAYLRIREGSSRETTEPARGVLLDWDKDGNLLCIEVLLPFEATMTVLDKGNKQ